MLNPALLVPMLLSLRRLKLAFAVLPQEGTIHLLVCLELFFEELASSLVYPWQSSIILAFSLLASFVLPPPCRFFLLHFLGSLVQLEVEVVDGAADLMAIETFGARQWLEARAVNCLRKLVELLRIQHLARIVEQGRHSPAVCLIQIELYLAF